jgi:predicted transcriptional regulator
MSRRDTAVNSSPPGAGPPASPIAHLTVGDAMRRGLVVRRAGADLLTIARTMAEESIHCVFIPDILRRSRSGERRSWGVVSDLGLMRGLRDGARIASDIAATELVTVDPTDTLETALRLMTDSGSAHLVVVSPEKGRPIGMVSTLDIARAASP